MKMIEFLSESQQEKFKQLMKDNMIQSDESKTNKYTEKLSRRDLEDLMGVRMDIYKRVRGAMRRR
ncbi:MULTISPECIES: hypothetical protein [Bacillaceae]|uniref:hypothetical protein n=1 Tax=Bacillaceae TaxID=186817 RepID=UPI00203ABA74|nr:hypothetical protein [Caldibacillus thermoamylovorans]MCM3053684.1 hypothetical protein [Caldibacillus thermoamylovorans]